MNVLYLKKPLRLKTLDFEPRVNYALGYMLLAVFGVVMFFVGYAIHFAAVHL